MARSFSSYGERFSPGYKRGSEFQGPTITGGAGFTPSLGDTVNLGNSYQSLRKSAIKNDQLASASIANRAAERATATRLEAAAHATGLSTMADVQSNKLISIAQQDAAKAEARGSMMGSAFGAIGSIGGALLSGGIV